MHTRALLIALLVATALLGSSTLTPRSTGAGDLVPSIVIDSIDGIPFAQTGPGSLVFDGAECHTINFRFEGGPTPGTGAVSVNGRVVTDQQSPVAVDEFVDVGDGIGVRVERDSAFEEDPDTGDLQPTFIDSWTVTICTSDATPDGKQFDVFASTFRSGPEFPDKGDAHTPDPLTFTVAQPGDDTDVPIEISDPVLILRTLFLGDANFHVTGDPPIDVTDPDTGGMLDFPIDIAALNLGSSFFLVITDPLAPAQPGDPVAAGGLFGLECAPADEGRFSCEDLDGRNWLRAADQSFTGSMAFDTLRNGQCCPDVDGDGTPDFTLVGPARLR